MADYTLIDEYLGQLRQETRWLRDAEEIAEEVADHLLEAVERGIDRGIDRLAAQRRALAEFGDPDLVGRAFASSRTGGAAMPTQFTRRAGHALIVSAFLWVGGFAIQYAAAAANRSQPWDGLPQTLFTISAIVLIGAGLLGAAGVLGIGRRHGGSLGLRVRIGFWLYLIAGIAVFVTWFWGAWATSLGISAILIGSALLGSAIAPRWSGALIGLGGLVVLCGLWLLQLTSTDISIDDPAVQAVLDIGILAIALGQAVLGRWLAKEEPIDEPGPVAAA